MLHDWEKQHPGRVENIFRSIQNVSPSQLADVNLFDFHNLPLDRDNEKEEYEFEGAVVSASNIQTGVQIIDAALIG